MFIEEYDEFYKFINKFNVTMELNYEEYIREFSIRLGSKTFKFLKISENK
jgi:hypothetical protein